jgi:hypothetical protein
LHSWELEHLMNLMLWGNVLMKPVKSIANCSRIAKTRHKYWYIVAYTNDSKNMPFEEIRFLKNLMNGDTVMYKAKSLWKKWGHMKQRHMKHDYV